MSLTLKFYALAVGISSVNGKIALKHYQLKITLLISFQIAKSQSIVNVLNEFNHFGLQLMSFMIE